MTDRFAPGPAIGGPPPTAGGTRPGLAEPRPTPAGPSPARPLSGGPVPPAPKRRPDARPTRVVLGLSTVAAMSVVTAGLVRFPVTVASDGLALEPEPVTPAVQGQVVHRIRYVQLRPGERAPEGATVIRGADPTPRVVVDVVPAPRQAASAPRTRKVARSRQSGG